MGVPAFYRWLSQRYPKAIKGAVEDLPDTVDGIAIPGATTDYTKSNPNGELDNLYLDMNGIVHPCTHPEGRSAPETEDEMMLEVFRYTDRVLSIAKPRKVLMIAVDGVAPRAKMNQQRSRRFRSAQDARVSLIEEERKLKLAESLGESLDTAIKDTTKSKWDTNVITPGTPFMDFLARSLRYWVAYKLNTEPGWKDLKVIISDASVPGEGEHKIMEFMRSQRNSPDYDPNTSHCIYGLDADLIFLGLATHEPHFRVLREDVFNQNKNAGKEKGYIWLDIGVLRQYLEIELDCGLEFWDLERAIDDWIFMAFFCGNDFLPHLPSLDVRENGLDILLRSWRQSLSRMGGFMTKDGDVVLSRVQTMLQGVANQEGDIFKKRHFVEKKREASRKQQQMAKKMRKVGYNDQHPSEPVPDVQLYTTTGEEVPNEDSAGNGRKRRAPDRSGSDSRPANVDVEDDDDDNDEVKLWQPGYHDRYYDAKFRVNCNSDPDFVREMAFKYIEGVCWVLKYYYQGCPSWTWFYPYHYAPFAQDLVFQNLSTFKIEFPLNTIPFLPFEQLMSVLPADSSHTLPKPLRSLMSDPDSPIIDFYPEDFPIDMNGKKMIWQGIALLPFIDETRLLTTIREKYSELTEFDMSRNMRKEPIVMVGPHSSVHSKLLEIYNKDSPDRVYVNSIESKGLCGTVGEDPDWSPNRPLISMLNDPTNTFEDLALDRSVSVEFIMPENQTHKSMLVPGFKEPNLVLGPSDIDAIWYRRKRSDRGDDRPDYRKQELVDFSEQRAKAQGTYSGFVDSVNQEAESRNDPRYQNSQGYQGYQSYQAFQGHQDHQGHQGYQGHSDSRGYQDSRGYSDSRGYQGYQGSRDYQGYQGYQSHQGHQAYSAFDGYQTSNNKGNGDQRNRSYGQAYQGNQNYKCYQDTRRR